jgi:multidrug efflux pump subunit AcrA (membrane-fusion protein)
MPDELTPARRRRRARRRRTLVIGIVAVVVLGGGGAAWAMSGSSGPSYRLATVGRSDVSQTVAGDGTLAAEDQATLDFATAGTVSSVRVAVGDTVRAGEVVATIDSSTLRTAVTTAEATLSRARQTLSADETAQADGTASTTSSTGVSGTAGTSGNAGTTGTATNSSDVTSTSAAKTVGTVRLMAATTPTVTPAQIRTDQQAVVTAQQTLDSAVDGLTSACTTTGDTETTQTLTAQSGGTVSGTVGEDATVVTIATETTTSDNPQTVAAGGSYSFAGLTAGSAYKVVLVPVTDNSACTSAISAVSAAKGSSTGAATKGSLYYAIDGLNADLAKLEAMASSSGSGSGSGSGAGSGSGSGSSGGSGSSSSPSTSGTMVTAEQIAADSKAIDAARAEVAVARNNIGFAVLTSPISGTVGTVALVKGASVSASSTSDTITVVGDGTLSVDVSVSLADIELIKVGETAAVTVDGRSKALPAKVSLVGLTNSSGSTGSSAAYTVTVSLDSTDSALYDGMGASVAIDVGTAKNVVSVPISALHTTGTQRSVDLYANGKVTVTRVTTGVEGADLVQIDSGLSTGQKIVLADIGAAIPSSTDTTTNRNSLTGGLSGTTGGFGGRTGGGVGGPPGN